MSFKRGGNIKNQIGLGKFRHEKFVELLEPFQFEILDEIKRKNIKKTLENYTNMQVEDISTVESIDLGILEFAIFDPKTKEVLNITCT